MRPFEAIPQNTFSNTFSGPAPLGFCTFEETLSDHGEVVYEVRSSVLGGQVVAELRNWGSEWG